MTEKTTPQPSLPKAKVRFMTPAVLIWAGLASLSLAYLGVLAVEPALVAKYLGARTSAVQQQVSETQRAANDALAEVRTLRTTLDRVNNELTVLKSEVSTQSERDRDVMERIAALEAPPQPPPVAKGAKAVAAKPPHADPAVVAVTVPSPSPKPASAPAPKKSAAAVTPAAATPGAGTRNASLETGSVESAAAPAEVTFGPATVTPAVKTPPPATLGVQVATGPSVDSLRLSWTLISERHGASLSALQPRYTVGANEQGVAYNLLVGPVNTLAEARQLCQELAAKATPCAPAQFRGDAL
ncbi:MAG: hypothetical protein WC807_12405 [Hyphomicrobium sp.]